ncbi:uncharacterized protein KIAA0895 isoform X2 [Takifugu rubripes]|uniref:uncharacterized protein KIAA0895 isoform X2 n=1 Tax=Takifugu rubripes TaxID=31033 RepID=UPI00016E1D13|nr:uncharacterized protein KIAA0895 homolog isoform X2 [Takifugu rubripes]
MLESIKVTERLHWPKVEMSKKYILNSADKTLSPSQVYLEKLSSGVFRDLFSSGSCGYNNLLHREEAKKSPKQSPFKRPKTKVKCGATFGKRKAPSMAPKKVRLTEGVSKPAQTNHSSCTLPKPASYLAVVGNTVEITAPSLPKLRETCNSGSSRTKVPSTHRAAITRELDGTKKLCILSAVKPTNVESEKVKFFKSGFSYNPQFEYSNPVSSLVLARHSNASDRFLTQIVVQVTDDLLSRASMTVVNSRPTLTINTSTAREHWLEGMLRHEIGTHYFRGINNCQQPWSRSEGRKKHSLKPLNPTEEGLASIHSVLLRKDPSLWRAALLYYTVYQASHMSFTQLFNDLGRFVQDPNTRWDYCVRAKRGQSDTAQPGCFSKDQVYLDGILKILRYRDKINFPVLMALGKVSYEDVERLKPLAHMENVRIPHFMQDQARYFQQLAKIMAVNQLTDEELRSII